jgi:hypothetical protein
MLEKPMSLFDIQKTLAGLRLAAGDREALTLQGFVSEERRSGRGPYYKLRWRRGERQRVRHLGADSARADQVRAALDELQRPRRAATLAARLLADTRRRLREAKGMLAPLAAAEGLYYHGYTLRRHKARPAPPQRAERQPA